MRILLVEDDVMIGEGLTAALGSRGNVGRLGSRRRSR